MHPLLLVRGLSLPLKVRARCEECHTLIHKCLTHPEVVIDPFLDVGGFADGFRFDTGTVSRDELAWAFGVWLGWWKGETVGGATFMARGMEDGRECDMISMGMGAD